MLKPPAKHSIRPASAWEATATRLCIQHRASKLALPLPRCQLEFGPGTCQDGGVTTDDDVEALCALWEVDQEEVIRRAAHLALEHFTHDLEGGRDHPEEGSQARAAAVRRMSFVD